MARQASSMVPYTVQPEAALCPPPPRRAHTAQASSRPGVGAQGDLALPRPQLPDGGGVAHPLHLAHKGGDVLCVVIGGPALAIMSREMGAMATLPP